MIGLSRIKRAISDVSPGGMQTGDQKVELKLCDAQRIEVEYAALISERDAALAQNAESVQRINQFIESISQLSNQVVDLQNTRDDLEQQVAELMAHNAELVAQVEVLRIAALNAIQRMNGGDAKADLRDAYDATPQQCLRQIQAEAGRAGFVAGYGKCWRESYGTKPNTDSVYEYADSYAERVKAGEV